MKKIRVVVLSILVTFILTSPLTIWLLHPETSPRILVVDKTVPHTDYREHASLFWVLNHRKVINPRTGNIWRVDRDYLGYYPQNTDTNIKPYSRILQGSDLNFTDTLFIADTYGVYTDDLAHAQEQRTHLDYSRLIYGGLSIEEAEAIAHFADKGGNVIAEFNTFASPTAGQAREIMENLLRVKWTEWSGRYFRDLASVDDVPVWARRNWREQYGSEWNFSGPGFLITHEDTRLFVLQTGVDVEEDGLRIVSDKTKTDPLLNKVAADAPFYYWFDFVQPTAGAEILAGYRLRLTDSGRELMKRFDLPDAFPAIVVASRKPLIMYLAGDFADNNVPRGPYYLAGFASSMTIGGFVERYRDQRVFFWEVYAPLVTNIIKASR
ncbi:MAG TPA: hypothetical protein PKW95_03115 [bacterium]|nr:hypothetical protein [bacterium]